MKIKTLLLLALSGAILPFTAQAQSEGAPQKSKGGHRPSPAELITRLDADQSDGISREEARDPMVKHFNRIDSDSSGEISKAELETARDRMENNRKEKKGQRGKKCASQLKNADTDSNGNISKAEAEAAGLKRLVENFDKVDGDGDGEVTKQEMRAMQQRKGPQDCEDPKNCNASKNGKGQKGGKGQTRGQ